MIDKNFFQFQNEISASRHDVIVQLTEVLTLLEIFLINNDYVAGEHLTIADISILANVTMLEVTVEFKLSSYPNIWNWINRLRKELYYFDQLTQEAFVEMRQFIEEIRDYHEEWSAKHYCVFNQCCKHPNGLCNNN